MWSENSGGARRPTVSPITLDWCLADSQLQCVINFLLVPSSNPIIINEASEIWRAPLSAARWQADGRNGEIHRGQWSRLCGKAGIWPWAARQTAAAAAAETSDGCSLSFQHFSSNTLESILFFCYVENYTLNHTDLRRRKSIVMSQRVLRPHWYRSQGDKAPKGRFSLGQLWKGTEDVEKCNSTQTKHEFFLCWRLQTGG